MRSLTQEEFMDAGGTHASIFGQSAPLKAPHQSLAVETTASLRGSPGISGGGSLAGFGVGSVNGCGGSKVGSPGGSCIGLLGGSRSGGAIGSWSGFVGLPGVADMGTLTSPRICAADASVATATGRFSRTDPLGTSSPQIQKFLLIALAAWFAASFTAAFASPAAFWASPFSS
jgi:hypothetical protein